MALIVRTRIALNLWRDRQLACTWRSAWRIAGEIMEIEA